MLFLLEIIDDTLHFREEIINEKEKLEKFKITYENTNDENPSTKMIQEKIQTTKNQKSKNWFYDIFEKIKFWLFENL